MVPIMFLPIVAEDTLNVGGDSVGLPVADASVGVARLSGWLSLVPNRRVLLGLDWMVGVSVDRRLQVLVLRQRLLQLRWQRTTGRLLGRICSHAVPGLYAARTSS